MQKEIKNKVISFWSVGLGLILCAFLLSSSTWQGSQELHTLMEVVATMLSLMIGGIALVKHYTQPNISLLIIGVGFLGTSSLDAYHAVVTSISFKDYLPSDLPALSPWSWLASRIFLSVFLFLSYIFWRYCQCNKSNYKLTETRIYLLALALALFSFAFFIYTPLPPAYYPEQFFHRPAEFIPGLFFTMALWGFLKKGAWKTDPLEYWLVLALIISVISEVLMMSFSAHLFDAEFDFAHVLKSISYLIVLIGLFINMYFSFKQEIEANFVNKSILNTAVDGIISINEEGIISRFNTSAEKIFAYTQDEMIGKNITQLMPQRYRNLHTQGMQNYLKTKLNKVIGCPIEIVALRKDNKEIPILLSISDTGLTGEFHFTGIIHDLSKMKEATKVSSEMQNSMDEHSIVAITDVKGNITYVNDKFCEISGYTKSELVGKNHRLLNSNNKSQDYWKEMFHIVANGGVWHDEVRNKAKDGHFYWVDTTIVPYKNMDGKITGYVSIRTDITNHIETKKQAIKASNAKSDFLSNMSHELRTPMNAILGFAQLLELDIENTLNKSQHENISEVMLAGKHLLTLINQILDLSKIDTGKIELSIDTFAISDVISESLNLIAPLAEKRGISVQIIWNSTIISDAELKKQKLFVRSDYTRLKQVFLNILSNAVKYNKENGQITINFVLKEEHKLSLNISDTGIGISQEELSQLFQPFARFGESRTNVEGTGLGLVITKKLVELMGGVISLESKINEGSTFFLEFPTIDHDTLSILLEDENLEIANTAIESNNRTYTVLYIEDNPANLRLVKQALTTIPDLIFLDASEALLGIELAIVHQPDLILMDINLPGMDGFTALDKLQQNEETDHIPVIAVSANAMIDDIKKGQNIGFKEYITKPVNVAKLINIVQKYLPPS